MGRRRKKTGEKKAGESNPFGVKKAPKKKNKKKRKKKKKVQQRLSEGEMTVDDVLLLTMSQGAKVSSLQGVSRDPVLCVCVYCGRGPEEEGERR